MGGTVVAVMTVEQLLTYVAAIVTALVTALVFVHRLLLKAQEDRHRDVIAVKDQVIEVIAADHHNDMSELIELRKALVEKDAQTLAMLTGVLKQNEIVLTAHTDGAERLRQSVLDTHASMRELVSVVGRLIATTEQQHEDLMTTLAERRRES